MNNEDTFLISKRIAEHKLTNVIIKCPKTDCSSSNIWKFGKDYKNGKVKQRYKCKKCGYVWSE